jgi:hypothetical protein
MAQGPAQLQEERRLAHARYVRERSWAITAERRRQQRAIAIRKEVPYGYWEQQFFFIPCGYQVPQQSEIQPIPEQQSQPMGRVEERKANPAPFNPACRFGIDCRRHGCYFQHPEGFNPVANRKRFAELEKKKLSEKVKARSQDAI